MRILFLTNHFPNSSDITAGTFNLSRAKALRRLGHDIRIIAPVCLTPPERFAFPYPRFNRIWKYTKHQVSTPVHEIIEGFNVYHPKFISLPKRWFWKYEVDLLHLFAGNKISIIVRHFKPDFIITSWIHPFGTYAKYIKKYYAVPILSIAEGTDILIFPHKYPSCKSIEKTLNQYCNKVLFVSDSMRAIVNEKLKIKSSTVIKNGFETTLFYLNNRNNQNDDCDIRLLSIGHLVHVKGHDILLQALTELGRGYHLMLVGDGVLREQYEEFVRDNNLMVEFAGQVSHKNIKTYLDNCDLLCMPSRSESFGIAALEAMACGVPVVATRVGGLPEMVIDGFNGCLCEPESSESLVQAITRARGTSWNNVAIAEWAVSKYGWDKWANEIINVYKNIS